LRNWRKGVRHCEGEGQATFTKPPNTPHPVAVQFQKRRCFSKRKEERHKPTQTEKKRPPPMRGKNPGTRQGRKGPPCNAQKKKSPASGGGGERKKKGNPTFMWGRLCTQMSKGLPPGGIASTGGGGRSQRRSFFLSGGREPSGGTTKEKPLGRNPLPAPGKKIDQPCRDRGGITFFEPKGGGKGKEESRTGDLGQGKTLVQKKRSLTYRGRKPKPLLEKKKIRHTEGLKALEGRSQGEKRNKPSLIAQFLPI